MAEKKSLEVPLVSLKKSFEIYKGNWKQIVGYQLLVALGFVFPLALMVSAFFTNRNELTRIGEVIERNPNQITPEAMEAMKNGMLTLTKNPSFIIGVLLLIAFSISYQLGFIKIVSETEAGKKTSIRKSLVYGLSNFLSFFWIAVVLGLLALLGFALLFFPGVFLLTVFSLFSIAFVVDEKRGLDALKTSYNLVMKNFWGVFGRLFVIFVISFLISLLGDLFKDVSVLAALNSLLFTVVDIIWVSVSMIFLIRLYKELKTK